jgi:phosphohistidine swiveling domain-containing protein
VILLVGAFDLVPLLLVLIVAVAFTLPAAFGIHALALVFRNPGLSYAAAFGAALGVGFVTERAARRRQALRSPKWVSALDALGVLERSRVEVVGGKAQMLARTAGLGAPVPDGIVLTSELVERVLAATAGGKAMDRVFAALPPPARREIEAFLGRSKGKVVVRASFTEADGKHAYPGVFPAVRDVEPGNREGLVAAILALVASADDPVGREYRRRRGASAGVARAVVIQRQIEADCIGAVASRGPNGRADRVTVDFARKRSPTRSYAYDLVDGAAVPLGLDEPFETPAWMHRLAILSVTLEAQLGGPVHIEFAIEGAQPYVLDVRRVVVAPQKTWVHAPPLDASGDRHPTFAEELRGGLPLVRRVLSGLLARAGASSSVKEDEVRYADGLVYFDAEILRRALAELGADVLLRGGLRATLRSIEPIRRRPLPAVPMVTEITSGAWHELRAWQGRHLLGAAEVRLELVAREWLIRTLLRLVDGSGSGSSSAAADRRGHPALRWVLARRVREASEEAERQRTVLEKAETELGGAVARLLARGAEGWNAMFKGDRHLHATLEEIDRWHEDLSARDALEGEWKSRRAAFDQRKDHPTVLRVHRPALPEESPSDVMPASPAPGGASGRSIPPRIRGLGVAPGAAKGPAVPLTGQERGLGVGAILLVSDPRSDLCPHVFDARGVILLTGGLVSPVATLAAELGVPVVLCPAARSTATYDVTIDGTTGTVVVHR